VVNKNDLAGGHAGTDGKHTELCRIEGIEAQLRQLPLFMLNSPGETQQDAQGRWQFHFRLTRSGAHDNAL
jgi:pilus assembly protein HofN